MSQISPDQVNQASSYIPFNIAAEAPPSSDPFNPISTISPHPDRASDLPENASWSDECCFSKFVRSVCCWIVYVLTCSLCNLFKTEGPVTENGLSLPESSTPENLLSTQEEDVQTDSAAPQQHEAAEPSAAVRLAALYPDDRAIYHLIEAIRGHEISNLQDAGMWVSVEKEDIIRESLQFNEELIGNPDKEIPSDSNPVVLGNVLMKAIYDRIPNVCGNIYEELVQIGEKITRYETVLDLCQHAIGSMSERDRALFEQIALLLGDFTAEVEGRVLVLREDYIVPMKRRINLKYILETCTPAFTRFYREELFHRDFRTERKTVELSARQQAERERTNPHAMRAVEYIIQNRAQLFATNV